MNKLLNEKRLTQINVIIVMYFILLYLVYLFNINFIVIEFFRETLTIPFLVAQIVFLVLGIKHLIKGKSRYYPLIISLILLFICSILTIGSILKYRV